MNEDIFKNYNDQHGVSMYEQSFAAPLLIIMLRHLGCAFCRRTLWETARQRSDINSQGVEVGLVHMDDSAVFAAKVKEFKLHDVPRFHDPDQTLYQEFGIKRAGLRELFNYRVWTKGFEFGVKHGVSWPESDPRQLPGAFLIDQGHVVAGDWNLSPVNPPDFELLLHPAKDAMAATA